MTQTGNPPQGAPGRTLQSLLLSEPGVNPDGTLSPWLGQFLTRLSQFVGPAGGSSGSAGGTNTLIDSIGNLTTNQLTQLSAGGTDGATLQRLAEVEAELNRLPLSPHNTAPLIVFPLPPFPGSESSSGVTEIVAAGLLSGGTITTSGTIGLTAPAGIALSSGTGFSALSIGANLTLASGTLSVNQSGFPVILHGYSGDGPLAASGTCLVAYPPTGPTSYNYTLSAAGLQMYIGDAPTANATLTIANNGSVVGSITIPAASTTPTITLSATQTITAGQAVLISGPVTPDATLAKIATTWEGNR